MLKLLKKINVFTILVVVITLAMGLRLNSLVDSFSMDKPVKMMSAAEAVENARDENPPNETPESQGALQAFQNRSEQEKIQTERGLPEFPVQNFSEGEMEILQSLSKRRDELEQREKQLRQRQALLTAAEQEVDRKINELTNMREELKKLLDQQDAVQEERLQRMVKIYESMKPSEAAAIFNTLDMNVLLSVIGRMSERKSAPIFADMNPDRAREVTIRLVEHGQLPKMPAER